MAGKVQNKNKEVAEKKIEQYGEAIVPDFGGGDKGISHMPLCEASDIRLNQFMLFAHPSRWTIIDGEIVPLLHDFRLVEGVDTYHLGRDKKHKVAELKLKKEENGWIFIPYNVGPNGSYMRKIEARYKNNVMDMYVTAWEKGQAGSLQTKVDIKAYKKWLVSLVEQGIIPDCDATVAEQNAEAALKTSEEMKRKGHNVDAEALMKQYNIWKAKAEAGEEVDGVAYAPDID